MPTLLQHFQRIDVKLGELIAALATKISVPADAGTFNPAAIDLTQGQIEYNAYPQTGPIAFGVTGTPAIGGAVTVNIRGNGSPITFPTTFFGLDGLTSGTVLTDGVSYPFYFRTGKDWVETSPGVFADRVLIGAVGINVASAHAASHVTLGSDKIRNATASVDGLATTAQVAAQLVPNATVRTSDFTLTAGVQDPVNTSGVGFNVTFPAGAAALVGCRVGLALVDITNPLTLLVTDGSTVDGLNLAVDTYQVDGPEGAALAWRRASASSWLYDGLTGMLGGGAAGDAAGSGKGAMIPASIDLASSGVYSPLAISSNTAFGVAANPISGSEIFAQLTTSGSPTLTWNAPLVAEHDLQNGSLPAMLEPGTYLLRVQYLADLGGSGQHRAVVRIG